MYSDSRYSLTRYSVNRESQTVEVAEMFSEALGMLAGAAVPVEFRERFGETCQGMVRGTLSAVSAFSGMEGLYSWAQMSANVLTGVTLAEAFHADICALKDTPAILTAQEAMDADLRAVKNALTELALTDSLSAQIDGSKHVPVSLMASEVLTSMMSAISQATQRAVFQLTIPPGGELRIDSELFTVLLDDENALHAQSGDWIDISRDLLRITVESASGSGLEGQLIYTERYL